MVRLVDVHAHLDFPELHSQLDEVLERSKNAGVQAIISNGVEPVSNRTTLKLAKLHPLIKPALGFYPTHIEDVREEDVDKEVEFIAKQDVLALGEVGLDKKFPDEKKPYSDVLFKKQQVGFEKFISLAEKKNLPLIIHSRKAELDVIEMLESSRVKKVVMHCFLGKKKLIPRIQDNGWTFSLPVTLLKLQQLQEMVLTTPLSQLLTETDSPYLGPVRGGVNEPANVALTIKKLAELKKIEHTEAADQVFMNYMKMFL